MKTLESLPIKYPRYVIEIGNDRLFPQMEENIVFKLKENYIDEVEIKIPADVLEKLIRNYALTIK